MTSTNPKSKNLINREDVNEMTENAIRRHNRRSTIISAILGWILYRRDIHLVYFMGSKYLKLK